MKKNLAVIQLDNLIFFSHSLVDILKNRVFDLLDLESNLKVNLRLYLEEFFNDLANTSYQQCFNDLLVNSECLDSIHEFSKLSDFKMCLSSKVCETIEDDILNLFGPTCMISPEKNEFSFYKKTLLNTDAVIENPARVYSIWPKHVKVFQSDSNLLQIQIVKQDGFVSSGEKKHLLDIRFSLSDQNGTCFVAHFLIGDGKNIYNFDYLNHRDFKIHRKVKLGFCVNTTGDLACDVDNTFSFQLTKNMFWGNGFCFLENKFDSLQDKQMVLCVERGRSIFTNEITSVRVPGLFTVLRSAIGTNISKSITCLQLKKDKNDLFKYNLLYNAFFSSKVVADVQFQSLGSWKVMSIFSGRDRFDGLYSLFSEGTPTIESQQF